jgi:hypothetical protein
MFYKKCLLCKKEFTATKRKRKYCSKFCSGKVNRSKRKPNTKKQKQHMREVALSKGYGKWMKGRKGNGGTFKKGEMSNEKHPQWKGDSVGYFALHSWIQRYKGVANKCEHCKTKAAKLYVWANIDHKYRRNLDDYISLCQSCHIKYDIKYNGLILFGEITKFTNNRLSA